MAYAVNISPSVLYLKNQFLGYSTRAKQVSANCYIQQNVVISMGMCNVTYCLSTSISSVSTNISIKYLNTLVQWRYQNDNCRGEYIFIYSCSHTIKEQLISKEIDNAKHEYMNMPATAHTPNYRSGYASDLYYSYRLLLRIPACSYCTFKRTCHYFPINSNRVMLQKEV